MKLRRRALNLIKKKYSGSEAERFGPTLAAEHLAEEDGIGVDHETLRSWIVAERVWQRAQKRKKHCQRRERKSHFGELVQLEGSFQDWLEGRGTRGCVMNMVDDATSETQARMGKEETIWAAAGVLRGWIEKYGVPRALYTDWKNVYKRKATSGEQLRGEVPVTQFGRMCQKLGIRIIAASSPQATGRAERNHGTHQDRLIGHGGRCLQLQPGQRGYGPTKSKALVCEWEDGTMEVYYRGERLAFTELKEPIRKTARPIPPAARAMMVRKAKQDHPWRQGYQNMKPRIPNQVIATPLLRIRTHASRAASDGRKLAAHQAPHRTAPRLPPPAPSLQPRPPQRGLPQILTPPRPLPLGILLHLSQPAPYRLHGIRPWLPS